MRTGIGGGPERRRAGWLSAAELVRSWELRSGIRPERTAVLAAVWERECGHMAGHWRLGAVRGGVLYVETRSPAAALELRMRGPTLARSLNKHFRTAWIKSVRTRRER